MNLRNMNCNSQRKFKHIAILVPAVAKSFHANADGQKNKKYDRTTLCISNSGLSTILKSEYINQRSVLSDSLVS